MSRNIFKLQQEYLDLMDSIEEAEGELTPEMEEQLAINIDDFENKMRSYTGLIKYLDNDATLISDEIDRLRKLQSTKNNIIAKVKGIMRDAIQLYGDKGKSGNSVLDLGDIKFYTRKNEVVKIYNEDTFLLTNDYFVRTKINGNFTKADAIKLLDTLREYNPDVKLNYEINKIDLKAELKSGGIVDGVSLIRNDNLIIK